MKVVDDIKYKILKPCYQKLRYFDYIVLYDFYKLTTKQNNKKVLMLSDSRDSLSGNLEFIYNELQSYPYEINTFLKKTLDSKKTFKEKKKLCYLIATSKFVLIDDLYPIIYSLKLKKHTELFQVWHSMGAFKTMGYSYNRMGKNSNKYKSLTHRNYTATVTSSDYVRKNYAEAFNIDINKVYPIGVPRTDIFFDDKYINNKREELYKKYPILKTKKVILYAPTFRGFGQRDAYFDYSLIDFDLLKKELKEDYVCIIKLHPFVKNLECIPKDDEFYLNLTSEREINDILFITDVLITDYSSVIFEYSLLNKPIIFHVPDLEDYVNKRDFFYSFDEYTYGSITKNMKELISSLKNPTIDKDKLKVFKNNFCKNCDGKSSKRFVEELILKR